MKHPFYNACGIAFDDKAAIKRLATETGISLQLLAYYNSNSILPFHTDLEKILSYLKIDKISFKIRMGIIDFEVRDFLSLKYGSLNDQQNSSNQLGEPIDINYPEFQTNLGKLYKGDCMNLMQSLNDDSIDMVFADPPFNLKKLYLSNINDDLPINDYLRWTEKWLNECIRILKPGGSLFLYNIPKWNTYFSAYLNSRLTFRHWIAVDVKYSLPIAGRLYPSHYSLLYYVKGEKPNTFKPDRLPMELCPSCLADLKDYGGYKDKMNPLGINITDVWYDIPPVRHRKYKRREEANELSLKLLDRVIEMSTKENDIVFDPFGGSGTTYITAEIKKRRWIGVELGPIHSITERFIVLPEEHKYVDKYRKNYNNLFPDAIKQRRKQLNLWTEDSFRKVQV